MIYIRIAHKAVDISENKDFCVDLYCQDDTKTLYDIGTKGRISCDIPRVIKYGNELLASRKTFFNEFPTLYSVKLLLLILAEFPLIQ
jgi:hypothetical protein